ncbi:MAG: GyrI-like domain-containing protein [Proteobacteria bacterium]|nr:GyrI-like domain-containing protein [Pseudomonadota bacterium]
MQKTTATLPEINLIGIKARTNNLSEMNPATGKILLTIQKYFHGALCEKIPNRKNPGVTYCVYTDYESDFTGDYTYFIGEEVESFNDLPEGFVIHTIQSQPYAKFTNGPGPMPGVCIGMWQEIWKMTPEDFGGKRSYIADFEIYDERALDHQNVTLDIYIGIGK